MPDRGVAGAPAVAVGIVEEAVSGLGQRQKSGAQKEGAGRQRLALSMIVWAPVLSRSPPASCRPG
jgi:hypothetical protein